MHHDTQGLANDAIILKEVLKDYYVEIFVYSELNLMHDVEIQNMKKAKVQIFLEHIYKNTLKHATTNIFVPNIEWCNNKDYQCLINDKNMHVFAKTVTSLNQLSNFNIPNKVVFTSWTSKDMYSPEIKEESSCLHVKGISKYKNTQILLDTWLEHPEFPLLHIVHYGTENSNGYLRLDKPIKISCNIILYQYKVDEYTLKYLMNKCKYHICPSYSEGWGHYIVEGMSCNKTVLTTNLPPMNEHVKFKDNLIDIKVDNVKNINMGHGATLESTHLVDAIKNMLKNTPKIENRTHYLKNKDFFTKRVQEYFKTLM